MTDRIVASILRKMHRLGNPVNFHLTTQEFGALRDFLDDMISEEEWERFRAEHLGTGECS